MTKLTRTFLIAASIVQLSVSLKAAELTFGAAIDGIQSGSGSAAAGSATVVLDTDANTIDLSINISNLRNDLVASHIHVGAAGETGGVIVGIGDISVYTVIGDFYVLAMSDIAFPEKNLVDLLAGDTYLNFHTPQFGSGEIRGQLTLQTTGSDSLVNLSTRGHIDPAQGAEATLIAGFAVAQTKRILLRGIGESLTEDGVGDPLEDIAFEVYSLDFENPKNTEMIGANDNWKDDGQQYKIAATGLPPRVDSEAAMIMTLEPGTYTLNAGATSGSGIALVEIFGLENTGVGSTIAAAAKEGPSQSFTILNTALQATGLDVILDGNGPFTLFAPTDEAFLAAFTAEEIGELVADDADKDEDLADLAGILSYHVVDGLILSSDIAEGTNAVNALTGVGLNVTLDENGVTVQDAYVIQTDIRVGNGVIHLVDGILAPYNIGSTIAAGGTSQSFTILSAALEATGLDAALDGAGAFTLFAPNDAAFLAAFTEEELNELLADDADKEADLATVSGILVYHVVMSSVLSTDLDPGVTTVTAINDVEIDVTVTGEVVTAENATVTGFDILASNGVIHVVDTVLSPITE